MSKTDLTPKQSSFVDCYLLTFNITQAYKDSLYNSDNAKPSSIRKLAYEVYKNPKVQAEIKRRLEEMKQDKQEILEKLVQKSIEIMDSEEERTSDKLKSMEFLAKLFSLTSENVNVNGQQDLTFNFNIEGSETKDE